MTILPDPIENTEGLGPHDTELIVEVKRANYKVHLCVGISSNIEQLAVIVCDSCAGPNLDRYILPPSHMCNCNHPIHSVSIKSAPSNHVCILGTIGIFVQLCDLHEHGDFVVMHMPAVPLLVVTSFHGHISQGHISDGTLSCPYL